MEALRRAVDPGTALRAGREALAHLAGAVEYQGCRRLVCYAELAGELPMAAALDAALVAGRQLLWPRIGPGDSLEFAACARIEDLASGRYGVREPPRAEPAAELGPDVLLLVPGLAFDLRGGRLGRGRGMWDRVLHSRRGAIAFGVGYEFQIVDAVPHGPHDRSVDALLTERGIRRRTER
jgi:5-formyltetrahydrofolate cyclo-ligase